MNLAFIGLGVMGGPMARRLVDAGHDVRVHDVRGDAVAELVAAGASAADTPRDAAAGAELVFTSLPTVDAVRAVVLDPDAGALSALEAGGILVEMSTISISLTRELHDACVERGRHLLDAPVTQATGSAAEGKLTIMVGGDPRTLERARGALETLGTHIVHMGPVGAGTSSKLATQYMGVCNMVAATEALTFARRNGVDLESLKELGPNSIAQSRMFPLVARWMELDDPEDAVDVRGFVSIFDKDIALAVDAAAQVGAPHDVGKVCAALFAEGMRRGWADRNYLSVLRLLSEPAVHEPDVPARPGAKR